MSDYPFPNAIYTESRELFEPSNYSKASQARPPRSVKPSACRQPSATTGNAPWSRL